VREYCDLSCLLVRWCVCVFDNVLARICRKRLEIEIRFQWITNGKWHITNQMVTWSMTSRTLLRVGDVVRAWRRLRLCANIVSSIIFNSYRFSTLQTRSMCSRILLSMLRLKRRSHCARRRASLRVNCHVQLVDVKCMVPPAPEHSQPALLTSESIRVTWHCPA